MSEQRKSRRASLATIVRGGSLYTVGKVVSDVGEFLLHLLVSRWLGAGLYGLFAYGKTLVFTALLLTNLGSDKSIVRYLPKYESNPEKRRFVLALAWVTSLGGGFAVASGLFVFAPTVAGVTLDQPGFVPVLRLFAVVLFVDTAANLLYATFRALEVIEYEVLSKRLLKPVLRVLAVGSAVLIGGTIYSVVVAMVVASVATLAVAGYLFVTRLEIRPRLRSPAGTRETVRDYYNYSLPLTAKDAGTVMQSRVDVLMVGVFLSSTAVGVYNVSVLLASVLYVPLLAANQLFAPVISRLQSQGRTADMQAIYRAVTRWIFTASLFFAAVLVVFRVELLGLFGPEFTAGTTVLVLFVGAQLCNAAVGPSGDLLMMTDHQYAVMLNEWVFGVANVVLTVVFIQFFGFVGAALASAGVLLARNLTKLTEVWYLERMQPYGRAFGKPLAAGGVAAAGMVGTHAATAAAGFGAWTGVAVGVAVGIGLYAGGLWMAGFEEVDYELYAQLVGSGQ
ncbi:probable RfbX family transport protein [Natronomonas pharaonis DSM 2160]|uniref:Probable RfbX family transport protein n=1 Tax=Natronomonas pharaonis (strain ATCC 35678 / DSM 2160 / CIP 103997 / JCM 8858 / NBRC 14720 / NCIMB 2260 / Gabara) TaxID=348780 RepID=A0A1U7EXJ8_NATPD|nr:oligosaccharide flippase family protein [Natronomonas pharaonis]CAI49903.1 probable RfbX family transport protein [Natronomonas pharaonis DSM 2160]